MDIRLVPAASFGTASADCLLECLRGVPVPILGLPTGNSPLPMYEELRRRVSSGDADLSDVRPFAIDEYVGPRSHPCSNHAFFARYWNAIAGTRPVQEFDPGSARLDEEAARFAEGLAAAGGLDLVVLGIGMNGHLAFNEPGSPRDSVARLVELEPSTQESARACWGDDVPSRGLTLGLRDLLAARRVLLLATGPSKRQIVRRAMQGAVGPECPASFLREHPCVTAVLDEAASAGLS
ncbi:MAG TPA: glucosamine-6-phosphate deaminase [Tepidiformaceae bacterium]|nr:glucosamine-6-phosphate deaminase [Tepidiformaceae bacterium]